MADSGVGKKILMFGAIGIGAWYLYENWATLFPAAAAAPATPAPSTTGSTSGAPANTSGNAPAGGSSAAGTSSGTSGSLGPSLAAINTALRLAVAIAFSGGTQSITHQQGLSGLSAGASTARGGALGTNNGSTTGAAGRGGTSSGALATRSPLDYFATPDTFNYYLQQVLPSPPKTSAYGWPPDVTEVFTGIDRTRAMSLTQYWNGMSAYLSSQLGMSGLGRLRGMGCVSSYERAYVTPNNPMNGGYFIK